MRPCFLVVDHEYPGSISTRKLVIETAKLNVLTAYSAAEAIETLARFPQVDGIVLDSRVPGRLTCAQVIQQLRAVRLDVPIIVVSPSGNETCDGEQYRVSSYDPKQLLSLLEQICSTEARQLIERSKQLGSKVPED